VIETLFVDGRIFDLILVLIILEGIGLTGYRRVTGRGALPVEISPSLMAGAFLVLAFRASSWEAGWGWIALFLLVALLAHVFDLLLRWRT